MSKSTESTYPLRAAARLTGLSPELLRAWERRYGAVTPQRTRGGTRRYRAADVERLRRLKAAVDAGHRIGDVAGLDDGQLAELASQPDPAPQAISPELLEAIEQLDAAQVRRRLSFQLAALGPARFAQQVAVPLSREVGERWAEGRLGIASEHLVTACLRGLLATGLVPDEAAQRGPRIVFATLTGERHELGLQAAALTALGAGAHPIYLGADLPIEELLRAAEAVQAQVVALSVVGEPTESTRASLAALRGGLPDRVGLWLGGARGELFADIPGVEAISDLAELESRVALLGFEKVE